MHNRYTYIIQMLGDFGIKMSFLAFWLSNYITFINFVTKFRHNNSNDLQLVSDLQVWE